MRPASVDLVALFDDLIGRLESVLRVILVLESGQAEYGQIGQTLKTQTIYEHIHWKFFLQK